MQMGIQKKVTSHLHNLMSEHKLRRSSVTKNFLLEIDNCWLCSRKYYRSLFCFVSVVTGITFKIMVRDLILHSARNVSPNLNQHNSERRPAKTQHSKNLSVFKTESGEPNCHFLHITNNIPFLHLIHSSHGAFFMI